MTDTRKTDIEEIERGHMERSLAGVVGQIRRVADQIEAEARRGILDAAEGSYEWSTYTRVASQVIHTMTWGVANANFQRLIETAADADAARIEKKLAAADTMKGAGAVDALAAMERAVKGWASGATENDIAMGRRDVKPSDEQPFVLADILNMINDAAREVGVSPVCEVP
jgi:hypothetical protein